MTFSRQNITIDERNLENVDVFIYLGVQVQLTKNGTELDKIKRRIQLTK